MPSPSPYSPRMPDDAHWKDADLLDGLTGDERRARIALLEHLRVEGFTEEEIRAADHRDELVFLPVDRVIGGLARYTGREVADQAGVDLDILARLQRAAGFTVHDSEARLAVDGELEAARSVRALLDLGLTPEDLVQVSRSLGRALGPLGQELRDVVLSATMTPGMDEVGLIDAVTRRTEQLTPLIGLLVNQILLLHVRQAVRGDVISNADRESGMLPGASEVAVAFADLVGFTRLGEEVPPEELGRVADRLQILAVDTLEPPVRLIKSLGDGVMLVSPQVAPLLRSALALVAAADAEGANFPQVHVGVAHGPAARRGGDWYGPPVNLASRISDAARAGSVLCTRAIHDLAADDFAFSRAGTRPFKGIPEPVRLFRVRPRPDDA